MAIFISKATQTQHGKRYNYYILKANFWDSKTKSVRQLYVASLGKSKTISRAKAKDIIERLRAKGFNVTIGDLLQVRGLRIVED